MLRGALVCTRGKLQAFIPHHVGSHHFAVGFQPGIAVGVSILGNLSAGQHRPAWTRRWAELMSSTTWSILTGILRIWPVCSRTHNPPVHRQAKVSSSRMPLLSGWVCGRVRVVQPESGSFPGCAGLRNSLHQCIESKSSSESSGFRRIARGSPRVSRFEGVG
jgi:hypothetical protein